MNRNPDDRRIKRTKKALKQSLLKLLREKEINQISIQELTEEADMNRATFYLHYRDIYDMLQQIEDEAAMEISMILQQHLPNEKDGQPYQLFVALLRYIQEDAQLCQVMLTKNRNQNFIDRMCGIVEEYCLHSWLSQYYQAGIGQKVAYFSTYAVRGFLAVVAKWMYSGMQESPEKMAELMSDMGTYGLRFLDMAPAVPDQAKR